MNEELRRASLRVDLIDKITKKHLESIRMVLCRRCNAMIHPEFVDEHDTMCPWTCGLCGGKFSTFSEHARHAMKCNAPMIPVAATSGSVQKQPTLRSGRNGHIYVAGPMTP